MEFDGFMPKLDDDPIRRSVWEKFQTAECHAKQFVSNWEWVELQHVDVTEVALWHDDGRIEVPDPESDALFHEIFHSALHHSPFKARVEAIGCEFYCECLCHTFQYFIEKLLLSTGGSWVHRISGWRDCDYCTIMEERSSDRRWDFQNGLATHGFIITSGDSLENFREMFTLMNRQVVI